MRPTVWLALAIALALVLGGVLVALLVPATVTRSAQAVELPYEPPLSQAVSIRSASAAPLAPPQSREPELESTAIAEKTTRREAPSPSDELITQALRDYAREGIAHGWARKRADPLPEGKLLELVAEFERSLLEWPEAMGLNAAERANQAELELRALDESDALAWLLERERNATELSEVASDAQRLARFFEPRTGKGATVDGPSMKDRDPLGDGATVQFPAGVFRVTDFARYLKPFPKDLTLRGAGMNLTLLLVQGLSPREDVERFTVEDCTLFAERGEVIRLQASTDVLSLRRIRVIGFDAGAGGANALKWSRGVFNVTQSRFEGGYGRMPASGANLLRCSGPLAIRFEQCTFERINLSDAAKPGAVFVGCAMIDLLAEPAPGALYQDCTITVLPPELARDEEVLRRDLNELFPGWKERVQLR